jgi:hypothetical protein
VKLDVQTSTAADSIAKDAFIKMMEKPSLAPLGFHSLGSAPFFRTREEKRQTGEPIFSLKKTSRA